MNKMLLTHVTTSKENLSFSVVIWNGSELALTTERELNLIDLYQDSVSIKNDLSFDLDNYRQLASTLTPLANEILTQIKLKNEIFDSLTRIKDIVFPSIVVSSTLDLRQSQIEYSLYDLQQRLAKLRIVASTVREGRLLRSISRKISVEKLPFPKSLTTKAPTKPPTTKPPTTIIPTTVAPTTTTIIPTTTKSPDVTLSPTTTTAKPFVSPYCGIVQNPISDTQVFIKTYDFSPFVGTITFDFDPGPIADEFKLYLNNVLVTNTGFVTRATPISLDYPGSGMVKVIITSNPAGTNWNYIIRCLTIQAFSLAQNQEITAPLSLTSDVSLTPEPALQPHYQLTGKKAGSLLVSDTPLVTVSYSSSLNNYELTGFLPKLIDYIKEGFGISVAETKQSLTESETLTESENETDSIDSLKVSLKDNLIIGENGIVIVSEPDNTKVKYKRRKQNEEIDILNKTYTLSFSPDFLTGSPTGGIVVTPIYNPTSGLFQRFILDLSPDVLKQLAVRYYAKNGMILAGRTLYVDAKVAAPLVQAGPEISVKKAKTNPDTYQVSFKPSSITKTSITSTYPIRITKEADGLDVAYSVSLDQAYTDNIVQRIANLETNLASLDYNVNHMIVNDFNESFKRAYMCPVIKLMNFVSGNYDKTVVNPNISELDRKLFDLFGPGVVTFKMNENMLPYMTYSEIGSGTVMGMESEIDLFIPLQNKLRVLLKDPTFIIKDEDKNIKWKIVSVNLDNLEYSSKEREELPTMFYNMEFVISTINNWVSWGTKKFGWEEDCQPITLSNWKSTKYTDMKLLVTGGDCDFIAGKARQNQKNATKLTFPEDLSPAIKVTLKQVNVKKGVDTLTYSMVIHDAYTNEDYDAKFRRAVGAAITHDLDYIEELAGHDNPGHVRAFARLYTNWKYSDDDLNRMLYWFGANNGCLADFAADVFYKGVLQHVVFGENYLRNVKYTAGLSVGVIIDSSTIDKEKGKAKIKIKLNSGNIGYSQFPIDLMLNYVKFEIIYKFEVPNIFYPDDLFADCCWGEGFKAKFPLTCPETLAGHLEPPIKPNPVDSFGKTNELYC